MHLIDTHCHLDVKEFAPDLKAVMARALDVDIRDFIVPAINQARWEHLKTLAEQYNEIHPAYGLHPMFMAEHKNEHIEALDAWLEKNPAIAVGECGLDFYIEDYDSEAQIRLFEAQLDIARNHQLPVIIHCRKAMDQVLKALRKFQPLTGVLHSFSGSLQQAKQAMELGFKFGIGGPITYERATKMRVLTAGLPRDSLLLETDAPDQPVSGHQGQRNEPALMVNVLKALAEARDESIEEVARYTTANARSLFKLGPG
jgi:TatD DNase family protein